ncbi:hypothetical protein BH10PAT2_BH10PAT2_1630 [soil metagenome]
MLQLTLSLFKKAVPHNTISDATFVQSLMNHFKADELSHLANIDTADMGYGWIHYGFIKAIKPRRILCIGSGYGFIPAVLAQACKENGVGHVDFVDAGYGLNYRAGYTWTGFWKTPEGKSVFDRFGLKRWITLYNQTTSQFAKSHSKMSWDYIYIDGDHLYAGVKFDYTTFFKQLTADGFLGLHDISITDENFMAEGEYGVAKLWSEIKSQGKIAFSHPASGLGIVQKLG